MNTTWKTQVYYDDPYAQNRVERVAWGPVIPGMPADDAGYDFFNSEVEAAQSFLNEIAEHPQATYRRRDYLDALNAVSK